MKTKLLFLCSLMASLIVTSQQHEHQSSRPLSFPDIPGYKSLKTDLHIHTVFSDGYVWPNIRVMEALRDNLDAIEVAISYQRLIDECSLTQEALGERVGKKRSTITNYLRLLKLPPQIQKAIMDRVLTMGHARAIINIDDESEQLQLFKEIVRGGLSVRAAEQASKSAKASGVTAKKELPIEYQRIQDNVKRQLDAEIGLKVNAKGKGSLSISFDNEKELKRVLSILDLWP